MSPNSNYISGRAYEYKIAKYWRTNGYMVVRAAGSHGAFDLVGFRSGRPVELIQCKICKSAADGNRMLKMWQASPPLEPSNHYHQTLYVKVKRGEESWALV